MKQIITTLAIVVIALSSTAKSKTIGDLLKNIETKAKKVKIKKSKTALPQYRGGGRVDAVKVNLGDIKPPSSSSLARKSSNEYDELESITDEEIKQLYMLTKKYKNSKARGEIWLRLAEAYVDKANTIEGRIHREYDRKMDLYQSGKTKRRPKLKLSASRTYNKKAIQLYEWFLRDFPKDSKVDKALFFLGYNHFELGNIEKGKRFYARLLKEKPRSSYVDQANFAMAEFYFENEKWNDALKYYLRIANKKRSKLHTFALYKASWCYYKTNNVKKALNFLVRVIKEQESDTGNENSRIRLEAEAKANLIPFYADLSDYKGAKTFFVRHLRIKDQDKAIERLAYRYVDMGKKRAARYYFRYLIDKNPYAPKAYDYQYQIVTMYSSENKTKIFKNELFSWIDKYGPNSRWAKKNKEKNPKLVENSVTLIETTLRTYTLQHHQTAQNSRGSVSQGLALSGYDNYFKTFKKTELLSDMHFYYGELLYDMGKFDKAAVHYLWVADNDPKSKFFEKSILNAILSIEKKLPSEKKIKSIVGKSTTPIKLDKSTLIFERIANKYFQAFPKSKNTVDIKYKLAIFYYSYNHLDKALALFEEIVSKHPKSKYAVSSGNIILDIYNSKKDYVGLEKAANKMLAIPAIAKSPFGVQVRNIKQRSSFKRAQSFDASKDYVKSAEAYADFAKTNPRSSLATSARFNAAVNYEKAGKLLLAVAAYEGVLSARNIKDKKLKSQSVEFIGKLYEKTGQFEKAAAIFEKAAVNTKDKKKKANFYFNAAVIRDGMRFYTAALNNYQNFYNISRGSGKKEALLLMARIWEKRRNTNKAISYFKRYIESNPSNAEGVVEASFKLGKLYESKKYVTKRAEWYKKSIAIQKRVSRGGKLIGVRYAAEAKFKLSYDTYLALRKIKIPRSASRQGAALKKKVRILEKLKSELKTVIKYDDGYMIVAALATLGQAYQHMSASLFNAPLPRGLKKDEIKVYKAGIAKVAEPFKNSSIENYKSSIEKAYYFESYSPWVKVASAELYRLNTGKKWVEEFEAFLVPLPDWIERPKKWSKAKSDLIDKLEKAIAEKKYDDVKKASIEILSDNTDDIYALNSLALYNLNKKRYGLSRILLARILEKDKSNPVALNNFGVVYLAEREMRKAIDNFRISIKSNPDYRWAAANIGSIYLEYKDFSRAISPLNDGYRITKDGLKKGEKLSFEMANNYAVALAGAEKYSKAEDIFEDILDVNDRNVTVLTNYAVLLVKKLGKKNEALDTLSKIKFLTDDKAKLKLVDQLEKIAYEKE